MGFHRAGFQVVGVDIKPQPHYPFEFIRGDALEYIAKHGHEFDAIHTSPPCQTYARVTRWRGNSEGHPDLVPQTRTALLEVGRPWVIENVPEAPVRADYLLCGTMFGLPIKRHRAFETSWVGGSQPMCGNHRGILPFMHKGERAYADAMDCRWMTNLEGREAIPPAYTEHIGKQLMAHLVGAQFDYELVG